MRQVMRARKGTCSETRGRQDLKIKQETQDMTQTQSIYSITRYETHTATTATGDHVTLRLIYRVK